jgi:hypothetical protein
MAEASDGIAVHHGGGSRNGVGCRSSHIADYQCRTQQESGC